MLGELGSVYLLDYRGELVASTDRTKSGTWACDECLVTGSATVLQSRLPMGVELTHLSI